MILNYTKEQVEKYFDERSTPLSFHNMTYRNILLDLIALHAFKEQAEKDNKRKHDILLKLFRRYRALQKNIEKAMEEIFQLWANGRAPGGHDSVDDCYRFGAEDCMEILQKAVKG